MNSYMRNYPKRPVSQEDSAFEMVQVYIPKSLFYILKAKSDEMMLPMSRLVCIALDNELEVEVPFNYPTKLPETPYVEYAFADEAAKIINYLRKFPAGTGRDTLLLCRRDYGVEDKDVVMQAYRELLEKGMIEEFRPKRTKFIYSNDYLYTRIVDVEKTLLKQKKRKDYAIEKPDKERKRSNGRTKSNNPYSGEDTEDPHEA